MVRVEDDDRSVEISSSSRKDSSAIALAVAINFHEEETGVRARPWSDSRFNNQHGFPCVFPATGDYDLFVNGIKVEVRLTQDEPLIHDEITLSRKLTDTYSWNYCATIILE